MTQTIHIMHARHWAVLLFATALFGSSFLLINLSVEALPPLTIAAIRAALAAPIVWAFLQLMGGSLPSSGTQWAPLSPSPRPLRPPTRVEELPPPRPPLTTKGDENDRT